MEHNMQVIYHSRNIYKPGSGMSVLEAGGGGWNMRFMGMPANVPKASVISSKKWSWGAWVT